MAGRESIIYTYIMVYTYLFSILVIGNLWNVIYEMQIKMFAKILDFRLFKICCVQYKIFNDSIIGNLIFVNRIFWKFWKLTFPNKKHFGFYWLWQNVERSLVENIRYWNSGTNFWINKTKVDLLKISTKISNSLTILEFGLFARFRKLGNFLSRKIEFLS